MLTVEMLAAEQGDAVWIEYGTKTDVHRVLIDAGTPASVEAVKRRIEALPEKERRFDLLVVSHIDTDHIGGVLKLLAVPPKGLAFDDVWFNAWRHIDPGPSSRLGPIDGEILSGALDKLRWPWNKHFGGKAVTSGELGGPPCKLLRGGMTLTVLSPGKKQLAQLRNDWRDVITAAGLDPKNPGRWAQLLAKAARKGVASSLLGDRLDVAKLGRSTFKGDTASANGSTIALLAEFEGASCVISGDAFAPVMTDAIGRLLTTRDESRLTVGAFKVPHHGSKHNLSNDLLSVVASTNYLFSTSGAIFGHPDDEAVGRVLAQRSGSFRRLHFNYPAETLGENYKKKKKRPAPNWNQMTLRRKFRYEACYASNDDDGLAIELQR